MGTDRHRTGVGERVVERWGRLRGMQCGRRRRLTRGPTGDEENRTHDDQNDYDENIHPHEEITTTKNHPFMKSNLPRSRFPFHVITITTTARSKTAFSTHNTPQGGPIPLRRLFDLLRNQPFASEERASVLSEPFTSTMHNLLCFRI